MIRQDRQKENFREAIRTLMSFDVNKDVPDIVINKIVNFLEWPRIFCEVPGCGRILENDIYLHNMHAKDPNSFVFWCEKCIDGDATFCRKCDFAYANEHVCKAKHTDSKKRMLHWLI